MAKQRVCIIGNSHAAAFRGGLNLLPELNETTDFDFFTAQSDLMREMELQGTLLVPTSEITRKRIALYSNGIGQIDTQQYDSFLIIGLGFGLHWGSNIVTPFSVFSKYQLAGFEGVGDSTASYISRPCFTALIKSILQNSTALYFARLLRSISDAQIFIVPTPYPSQQIIKQQKMFWKSAVESGLWSYAKNLYEKTAQQIVTDIGCEVLSQPNYTLTPNLLTKQKFSHNSLRLSVNLDQNHPPSEPYHMNALYGAKLLNVYQEIMLRSASKPLILKIR